MPFISRSDSPEFRMPGVGSALVIPPHVDFSLSNPHDEAFEAVAVLPIGGQARIGDAPPFTPPWAT